jgi:hypothetical protein
MHRQYDFLSTSLSVIPIMRMSRTHHAPRPAVQKTMKVAVCNLDALSGGRCGLFIDVNVHIMPAMDMQERRAHHGIVCCSTKPDFVSLA